MLSSVSQCCLAVLPMLSRCIADAVPLIAYPCCVVHSGAEVVSPQRFLFFWRVSSDEFVGCDGAYWSLLVSPLRWLMSVTLSVRWRAEQARRVECVLALPSRRIRVGNCREPWLRNGFCSVTVMLAANCISRGTHLLCLCLPPTTEQARIATRSLSQSARYCTDCRLHGTAWDRACSSSVIYVPHTPYHSNPSALVATSACHCNRSGTQYDTTGQLMQYYVVKKVLANGLRDRVEPGT